tara:strand:+ start:6192 stop:6893 length:702 start_codon:yes stop_codon:yes gene_type:complete
MGRIEKLKRQLIEEANKKLLSNLIVEEKSLLQESSVGKIDRGDNDFCLIQCNIKHARNGSNGDMVKKIQHLLDNNGFNVPKEGGGILEGCMKDYRECDGLFRKETKKAVEEFQRKYGVVLKVDGIVGPKTYELMCEELEFTPSLRKEDFCVTQCACTQIGFDEPMPNSYQNDCKGMEICISGLIGPPPEPRPVGIGNDIKFGNDMRRPTDRKMGDMRDFMDCLAKIKFKYKKY